MSYLLIEIGIIAGIIIGVTQVIISLNRKKQKLQRGETDE